jgi:hypothetical protein
VAIGGKTQTQIIQNGTTTLVFVNQAGTKFNGSFTDATHFSVPGFGTGTISNGKITWSSGEVWYENLTVTGTKNGATATPVSITAVVSPGGVTITMTDGTNTFQARLTSANTIVITVGSSGMAAGVTGTRKNGAITWSNGVTWNNFDFNALDALFAVVQTYPFG